MRIPVSGTHRIGKTTLVEAFARARPDFEVEPEPYEQLLEAGGVLSGRESPRILELRGSTSRRLAGMVAWLESDRG